MKTSRSGNGMLPDRFFLFAPMLDQIDHVNLVVRDLELMTQFYGQVLGLAISKRATIRGPWVEKVVGLLDVEAIVVYLECSAGPRLELIQYLHPAGARPSGLDVANTLGLRHLAFRVKGIDRIVAALSDAGVELLGPVQQVPQTQVTYADNAHKRLVYFRDPEDNLLELCEYK